MDIKFYENKVNLNWKQVLKSIVDVSPPPLMSDSADATVYFIHHYQAKSYVQ